MKIYRNKQQFRIFIGNLSLCLYFRKQHLHYKFFDLNKFNKYKQGNKGFLLTIFDKLEFGYYPNRFNKNI